MPPRNRPSAFHDGSLSEPADTSTLLPISPCPSARGTNRPGRTDSRRPDRAACTDGQGRSLQSGRRIDRENIEPPRTRRGWLYPTRPERDEGSCRTAIRFSLLTSNENEPPPITRDSARMTPLHHFLCQLPSTPITTRQKLLQSSKPRGMSGQEYSENRSRNSAVALRPGMKTSQRQRSTRPTIAMAN